MKFSKFQCKFDIFHRFTHYFVEFCCDRRLRTFFKVLKKICNIHVQNKGGGVKGNLNSVRKTALLDEEGFPNRAFPSKR